MLTQTLRPFSWDEIVGQKGIVKEMRKRSKTMEFPEVMLFEGASGTGKSTMAFIISALLSDKNPIIHEDGTRDPNPESPSSKAIIDMKFNRDVIYKDASSMSKEDVLDLQKDIANAPMFDGTRVIIIDECFHKDTLIKTENGSRKISEIKAGMKVWSLTGLKKVTRTFINKVQTYRLCRVIPEAGETIYTTIEHMFFTNKGWKKASDLQGLKVLNTEELILSLSGVEKLDPLLDLTTSQLTGWIYDIIKGLRAPRVEYDEVPLKMYKELENVLGFREYDPRKTVEDRLKELAEKFGKRVIDVERFIRGYNEDRFIDHFSLKELEGPIVDMYDLEVEEDHAYTAGGVIVHNCQELSKAGKGATLTLLEKKRKNAYLILCTMDVDKLDKAVKSRATTYSFKSPNSNDIAELLLTYTDDKHLNLPMDDAHMEFYEKGIFLLAENCEGSVRMAVQNFERCVQGEFFSVADIEREFNFISQEKLNQLLMMLHDKKPEVIKEIKTFGSKDFYYKMMKVLGDSYLYSKTGYVDAAWKKSLADRLSTGIDLYSVMSELQKAELNGYFREDLFLMSLTKAFFDVRSSMPLGITASEPVTQPATGRRRVPVQG